MTEPNRKLSVANGTRRRGSTTTPVCPTTGLTIPECSCLRCATEQIRRHAPWVLDGPVADPRPRRAA